MWHLVIQRNSVWSLSRQIYQQISEMIRRGQLSENTELPSTRELADELGVSRNTVTEAYELLLAEGYLVSRQGAPTRVAAGIRQPNETQSLPKQRQAIRPAICHDFHTGRPDLQLFPFASWQKAAHEAIRNLAPRDWSYADAAGLPALRTEIAAWLFRSRGMTVSADDIMITAGATQALAIAADLLGEPGRPIMMEDPCHLGLYQVLRARRIPICPVGIDQHGILPHELCHPQAAAIYVTPSHQFPIGGILPADRRSSLIEYALSNNQFILEDDYDSEFRYSGEPVSPLWRLAPDRVIYIGTFSKILFPAIRIGYAIVPPALQKRWRFLRTHLDVQNPPFEQASLANFMANRQLDRHIRRMRRVYAGRRNRLIEELRIRFGDNMQVLGDASGLHLAVSLPEHRFDQVFAHFARESGIYLTTAFQHSIRRISFEDTLILGFGHLDQDAIRDAVGALAELIV